VAGIYIDTNNAEHAFTRTAAGVISAFDAPGAAGTGSIPVGIDSFGNVAGMYQDGNKAAHGFVRMAATGTIVEFSAPGAGSGNGEGTYPICIDAAGDVAGVYMDSKIVLHGFVRSATGTVTTFDATGAGTANNQGTYVLGIGATGQIVGLYLDQNSQAHGFVRSAAGTIAAIDAPGAGSGKEQGTAAYAIDASGNVAGMYADANDVVHGYVRSTNGTVTSFDAPGAGAGTLQGTYPDQFDASGDLAGSFIDANNMIHGFMRSAAGSIAAFDAPGARAAASAKKGSGMRLGKAAGQSSSVSGSRSSIGLRLAKPNKFLSRVRTILGKVGPARRMTMDSTPTGGIFDNTQGIVAGTIAFGVDAAGDVTGMYSDGDDVSRGFLRAANGSFTTFDAPGAGTGALQGTGALGITAAGSIVGTYADENSIFHGYLLTLGQGTTTTKLTSAPASSVYGEPVTLTSRVSAGSSAPPDGESVWFMNGKAALGTKPLAGGSASFTTTDLPGGTNSVTAVYAGDTNLSGSTSAVVSQAVAKASSNTSLVSSLNPAGFAQFVAFTATVSGQYGGVATGSVTFKSGTATLGVEPIYHGSAIFATSALALGGSAITAVYAGDANFTGSTSNAVSQVVSQAAPTLTWATPAAIPFGMPLSAAQLDAVASVPGTFVYSPAAGTVPGIGSQKLSVTFTPANAAAYTGATASVTLEVKAAAVHTPTVVVTPSSTSITTIQVSTVTVDVHSGNSSFLATGAVVLTGGGYTSEAIPLSGGSATFGIPAGALAVGQYVLTATYTPDAASWFTLTGAMGTSVQVTVTKRNTPPGAATTLTMTSGGAAVSTVSAGSVVTLTATVKSGTTPLTTGLVNFCDATAAFCTDIHLLGSAQLTHSGTAWLKLRPGVGSHSLKAVFAGTKAYASGTSAAAALTVTGANQAITSITETGDVGNYTLTATVGAQGLAAPTGTVSFLDSTYGNAVLGSGDLQPSSGGLNWISSQTPSGSSYAAIAVGDFNGDGIPDLAIPVYGYPTDKIVILLGNGDGTFTAAKSSPAAGIDSSSVAVGDFNGDGIPDLVVANQCGSSNSCSAAGSVTILLGNGDGSFTEAAGSPVTVGNNPKSVVVGDFNGDGIPDLAVVNEQDSTVTILLGRGNGFFVPASGSPVATGYWPSSAVVGDFNGDGVPDLAVANESDSTLTILLGNGNGTFNPAASPSTGWGPMSLTVADFNGDGILDLATADGWGGTYTILLGLGDGTFAQSMTSTAGSYPMSIAVADLNGDGIPDLGIVNEGDNSVNILLGSGDGSFIQPANSPVKAGSNPESAAVGDFNGDGVADLFVACQGSTDATVLLTAAQSAAASVTGISVSGAGPHLAVASYPGDSEYSASVSAPASLYAPSPAPAFSPAGGAFAAVQTVTITDAVAGAVIRYTTDGSTPTTYSTRYIGPITVSATETIKAIAIGTGYGASAVATASFNVTLPEAAMPVFTPPAGVYAEAQGVTITDATPGSIIYYTTNGSTPTTNSARYTGPISVTTSETLVAFAVAAGYSPSLALSAQYTMSSSPTSMIYTIAGINLPGPDGDGGPAVAARLNYSMGTALDSSGNLYIADTLNNRVRRVDKSTGTITTVVGTELAGYSGDGGPAATAQINYPTALAFDPAGNLYIADTNNSVIRKVDANSKYISTFAGHGTLGYLANPYGVATDGAGNVFIADTYDGVVQEVLANSGSMVVIAGNYNFDYTGDGGPATDAALQGPTGVAVDKAGNVYIADDWNNVIRMVTAGTNVITTVAGNGFGAFSGIPSYIGDGGPATSAQLYNPESVALDGAGNLYITDTFNNAIREVSAKTQIITTVAGNGSSCWGGDGGPATSAQLCNPAGVTLDSAGNLYIADTSDYVIRKVFVSGLPPVVPAAAPAFSIGTGNYATPQTVTISDTTPGASIYVTLDGTTPTSASHIYIGPMNITGTVTVKAIAIASGYLQSAAVTAAYTFTTPPATVISTIAGSGVNGFQGAGGPATSAKLGLPYGLIRDANGNLYITDYGDSVVWKVDAQTGNIAVVAGNGTAGYTGDGDLATKAQLNAPMASAMDALGNLYIADSSNNVIRKVAWDTGIITTISGDGNAGYSGNGGPAAAAELNDPQGLVFDKAGNLYIADTANRVVRRITGTAGTITNVAGVHTRGYSGDGGLAINAGLASPAQLAFDSAGNLYIEGGARVRMISATSGIINTLAGNGIGGESGDGGVATAAEIMPRGVALDGSGNLYIGDVFGGIRVVSPTTGIITRQIGNGYCSYSGDGGAPGVAGICSPHGMVFDAAGNLYFADLNNFTVRMVAPPQAPVVPVITWPVPDPITYGTALSAVQLDATTTVPGDFAYNPQAGTVLPAGTQTLGTTFTPANKTKYATATSSVPLQVNKAASAATLGSSASSVTVGSSITLTATLTGPGVVPTGTVTFFNGSVTLGTGPLSSGVATLTVSSLPIGNNSITAAYEGDSNYFATSSNAVGIAVSGNPPATVGLTASANPITYGTSVTFTLTASGSGNVPTGTVTFLDGATVLGATPLNSSGVAALATAALAAGPHTITASYPGDTHFGAVTSSAVSLTVNKAAPVITWAKPAAIKYGTPLGSNQLNANASVQGTLVYSPIAGTVLAVGTPTLSVNFTPNDTGNYTANSATVTIQVTPAVLTVTATDASRAYGAANPTFTAGIAGFVNGDAQSAVTGSPALSTTATLTSAVGRYPITAAQGTLAAANYTFTFAAGTLTIAKATPAVSWATPAAITYGTALSSTQLNATSAVAGKFTYTPAAGAVLTVGTQALSATLAPTDATDYTAGSASVNLVVNRAKPSASLKASSVSVAYGASVTLTATLTGTGVSPAGSVAFLDGATQLGTGTLNASGVATCATTSLAVGSHSITASYLGDTNYTTAVSAAVSVSVTKATQKITFSPLPATFTYGMSPINLSATSDSGLPVAFSVTGPGSLNGNTITITGAGSVVVAANQAGNGNYSAAAAVSQTIKVNKATPTAALLSSELTGSYGASVTLTATLTGAGSAPTGTVTFQNGSTSIGTGTLNSNGVAMLVLTTLPIGADSLKASYGGDTNYATATSAAVSVTINKSSQTITFTPLAQSVTYGVSPIALAATSTSGLAVTFGATGPATVTGSTLTITGAGSVVVTASQTGNGNYAAATPVSQTISVTAAAPSIALKTSAGGAAYGATVTFTATLTGGATKPAGTVTFLNGNSAVGTGVLNASGVATLAIATLPVGSDSITASYPGDSRYLPGVSAPAIETVSPGTATAKLTSSASSASYGASVTLTATLTGAGAKPTGTINFLNGNTSLGTGTLNSSGVATLATTALPVGADSLKAAYSGDANYAAATSPALAVTIGKAAQTITFTAPATPVTYGAAPIALAATANSGLTVTFTTTGPATVNGSTLTITGAGSVTVSASQTGNSNYAAATAVSKTITVNKATPTDIVTPSSTTAPNGSSVTFTAAVTGPGSTAPTGTVTFMDGTTTLGTGKLTSGSAAYSTTKLTTGIHTVTAKYAGDTNYAAATSVGVTVTITAK